jgi:V/A-type H+-transporting ATPase subunit D
MAKIKHTKNELKAQNEALSRFKRFLPMLLLKKQQLQMEIQKITHVIEEKDKQDSEVRESMSSWIKLLSEDVGIDTMLHLDGIETDEGNIAGVAIPLLKNVLMKRTEYDLYSTPTWLDDALDSLEKLIHLRAERDVLKEQRRLVSDELRTTSQRVNLFEKIKIPECQEHIRVIKIFLGDEQTAAVVRGKIAKGRGE